jgi:Protein of unknown function DUF262/HNH endonuclease
MPRLNPNLDALIPREDFEVDDEGSEQDLRDFADISSLEKGHFFYESLRKPDFQRETGNWQPDKICEFIRTFLDGDLIPALILWKWQGNSFVIDGAHRLSALISWVQDDYGDGARSLHFYANRIPEEQKEIAKATRDLIKKKLGSYQEYRAAASNPDPSKPEIAARAKRLGARSVRIQWVTGDPKKAEDAFFKINQEATPIDKTELRILRARHTPSAISARVILRAATGHKYWRDFLPEEQEKVVDKGKRIHADLFTPPLNTPIKTLDLPVAGRSHAGSSLPLIFDLVNISNDQRVVDPSKSKKIPPAQNTVSPDGPKTVEFLRQTERVVNRIVGVHPSCLGLHPAVYFYSATGRHQPTSFLAVVSLIKEFERRDWFARFTSVRRDFEDFLLKYKDFSNQITIRMGSGVKGFERLKALYLKVLELLSNGKTEVEILDALKKDEAFSFLVVPGSVPENATKRKRFNTDAISQTFLNEALGSPIRCKICNGLIHVKSITIDHVQRIREGGVGDWNNGQLAHPYCNTTHKQ